MPVVSFALGIPDATSLDALRRAGSVLVQTVTSSEEARHAAESGADVPSVPVAEIIGR